MQRYMKLEEALGLLNNLHFDENDRENSVLLSDASEIPDHNEGAENDINTFLSISCCI